MGKIITQRSNRFDGGMTRDVRTPDLTRPRVSQHFNNFTYPFRLVPYHDQVDGDSGNNSFANFLMLAGNLYGLGVVTGTTKPQVFKKTTFNDAVWTAPNNNQGASARASGLFVAYKISSTVYIFGAQGGNSIWKFDTGGGAWTDAERSLSYTTVAQGIVHSKDDTLYIPYDNKIARNNAGSWTDAPLTLPTNCYITSICEYGNYLAIATAPLGTNGGTKCRVYLWDRDASLTTLSDSIEWGTGVLQILEEVEGQLVGVSYDSTNTFDVQIIARRYNGTVAEEVDRIVGTSGSLKQDKQKVNRRLYFLATLTIDGTQYDGIWTLGRSDPTRPLSFSFDRSTFNDTATNGTTGGFYMVGDYAFIAYDSGGNGKTSKTNDQASYTATSIWETTILDGQDPSLAKKLIGVTVTTAPLPAAGQVVLKYKKDAESSWTTIFTNTTDNSISHSSVTVESTGANLPEFQELRLRIESTGGAEITGFSYDAEVMDKRPY